MRRRKHWGRALMGAGVCALGLASSPASAQSSLPARKGGDGVHGRFDGDLAWSLGAGAEVGFSPASPRLMATAALRYYSFIGWYGSYRESLRDVDPVVRGVSTGILLEPLFLLRWSRGASTESPFWDLTIDSFGVSVGAHFEQAQDTGFGTLRGLEAGVGGGIPLMGSAQGLWLRGRAHLRGSEDRALEPVLWLTLEWQGFWETWLTGAE